MTGAELHEQLPDELPVVQALRKLSIFGADQAGAYREHFASIAAVLGDDIPTRLVTGTRAWADSQRGGMRVLTGNAGTGKTAAAEAFATAAGGRLPKTDGFEEVGERCYVIKDLSGILESKRHGALEKALTIAREKQGQVLMCANEGVLRDSARALGEGDPFLPLLERALRRGAAEDEAVLILNVNRQRPTAEAVWYALVDFVARAELWEPRGCAGCPGSEGGAGCPFRANAAALRAAQAREGLRALVRVGSGEAVPTFREVLAILAWALVGGSSCADAKRRADDLGRDAFTASDAYFWRALGGGLRTETAERSPLLMGIRKSRLGFEADLEVDDWLRDSSGAPPAVQQLAGAPDPESDVSGRLGGSRTPLDRVSTGARVMTFHALGEVISTGEDVKEVEDCLQALVGRTAGDAPLQALWRQRMFFDGQHALGGLDAACERLLEARHLPEFLALAEKVSQGADATLELGEIVRGLNFLVCGFSSSSEGLIVPDQACLSARDPGSFRPARPSVVATQIPLELLAFATPDEQLVELHLDVDRIELDMHLRDNDTLALRIRPRLYEAIREAAAFQGPVGSGAAEMTDLRGFYGRLATELGEPAQLRIADPSAEPPALVALTLPHFS